MSNIDLTLRKRKKEREKAVVLLLFLHGLQHDLQGHKVGQQLVREGDLLLKGVNLLIRQASDKALANGQKVNTIIMINHPRQHCSCPEERLLRGLSGLQSLVNGVRVIYRFCTHHIPMEQDHRLVQEHQCGLNNVMREVVKNEALKLLKARVIYPIADSEWVNPMQVVPKNGGMTVLKNEKNELIPQSIITGW
jgi:hypothetical protein